MYPSVLQEVDSSLNEAAVFLANRHFLAVSREHRATVIMSLVGVA